MTFGALAACATGVGSVVGGAMRPAPTHEVGKVHAVGSSWGRRRLSDGRSDGGGGRSRRRLLSNGCGDDGGKSRMLVRRKSRRRRGRRRWGDGMGAVVTGRLSGDSHAPVRVVATEVGLKRVECFGSRMEAPVATSIVEEAGSEDEIVADAHDGELGDGFASSVSETGTAFQLSIQCFDGGGGVPGSVHLGVVGVEGIGCNLAVRGPQVREQVETGDASKTMAWMGERGEIEGVDGSEELLD